MNTIEFQDLLCSLRTREEKIAQKLLRMRSHIGVSKLEPHPSPRLAHAYRQDTIIASEFPPESRLLSETAELKKQIA